MTQGSAVHRPTDLLTGISAATSTAVSARTPTTLVRQSSVGRGLREAVGANLRPSGRDTDPTCRAAIARAQQQHCRRSPSQSASSGSSNSHRSSGERHHDRELARPRHARTRAASVPLEPEFIVEPTSVGTGPRRRHTAPAGPSASANYDSYPSYQWPPNSDIYAGQTLVTPPASPEQFYHPSGMFYRGAGPGAAGAPCWVYNGGGGGFVPQMQMPMQVPVAQYFVAPSISSQ